MFDNDIDGKNSKFLKNWFFPNFMFFSLKMFNLASKKYFELFSPKLSKKFQNIFYEKILMTNDDFYEKKLDVIIVQIFSWELLNFLLFRHFISNIFIIWCYGTYRVLTGGLMEPYRGLMVFMGTFLHLTWFCSHLPDVSSDFEAIFT